jgi:hypothetical protein
MVSFQQAVENHMQVTSRVYNMFARLAKSAIIRTPLVLLLYLLCMGLHTPVIYAQEVYYVNSPDTDLNVRREPGTEHDVVTRLPHGTPVFVQDRHRLWLKIVSPSLGIEGWVLQRYLANQPPDDPPTPGEVNRSAERERFERLKHKGIIRVKTDKAQGVARIWMSDLIWQRLSRGQQQNFLERASRLYGTPVVELYNHRGSARSRLNTEDSTASRFESLQSD